MKFVILDTRIYAVCIFVKVIYVHIEFLSVKLLNVLQYIIIELLLKLKSSIEIARIMAASAERELQ